MANVVLRRRFALPSALRLLGVLLGLLIASCTNPTGGIPGVHPIDIAAVRSLGGFGADVLSGYSDLADLAADLDAVGLTYAMRIIDDESFPENLTYYRTSNAGADIALAAEDATGAPADGYETNTQVSGVDEVDTIKSDGGRIVVVSGHELLMLGTVEAETAADGTDTTSANPPSIVDRITPFADIDGAVRGMLLAGSRLIVFAETTWDYGYDAPVERMIADGWSAEATTDVAIVDIVGEELQLVDTTTFDGRLIDARLVGDTIVVVAGRPIGYDIIDRALAEFAPTTGWTWPWSVDADRTDTDDATTSSARAAEARAAGARGVRDDAIDALSTIIPAWRNAVIADLFGPDPDPDLIASTLRLYDPKGGAGSTAPIERQFSNYVTVTAIPTTGGFSGASYAAAFSTGNSWNASVYVDAEYLVLADEGWAPDDDGWYTSQVNLTVFALAVPGGAPEPRALGTVDGRHLSQFSLDVHDDYLRIVTTTDARWAEGDDGVWSQRTESETHLFVLDATNARELGEPVGELHGLGVGETARAVRFLGDTAYVVTFETIDPLYAIDLSDPRSPRTLGEAKVPGFSTYLHPMGDGYLVAVGENADADTGWSLGLQVALWDARDPAAPTQTAVYTFPEGAYSASQYDHRAFRFVSDAEDPNVGTLMLPVSTWSWSTTDWVEEDGGAEDGAAENTEPGSTGDADSGIDVAPFDPGDGSTFRFDVLRFDPSAVEKIALRGTISFDPSETDRYWYYRRDNPRALVIGGTIYATNGHSMRVNAFADLSPLGHIAFAVAEDE